MSRTVRQDQERDAAHRPSCEPRASAACATQPALLASASKTRQRRYPAPARSRRAKLHPATRYTAARVPCRVREVFHVKHPLAASQVGHAPARPHSRLADSFTHDPLVLSRDCVSTHASLHALSHRQLAKPTIRAAQPGSSRVQSLTEALPRSIRSDAHPTPRYAHAHALYVHVKQRRVSGSLSIPLVPSVSSIDPTRRAHRGTLRDGATGAPTA